MVLSEQLELTAMSLAPTQPRQLKEVCCGGEGGRQGSSELSGEPRPPEPRGLRRNEHLSELELSWERPELRRLGR